MSKSMVTIIFALGCLICICFAPVCCGMEGSILNEEELIRSYLNEEKDGESPYDRYSVPGEIPGLIIDKSLPPDKGLSLAHVDESKINKKPWSPPRFPSERIFLEHYTSKDGTELLVGHYEPVFCDNLAVIRLYTGKFIVVDPTGMFVIAPDSIPANFSLGNFREGRAPFYVHAKYNRDQEKNEIESALNMESLSSEEKNKRDILTVSAFKMLDGKKIDQTSLRNNGLSMDDVSRRKDEINRIRYKEDRRKLVVGFIDKTGKVVFSNTDYEKINRYSEHLALVRLKGQNKYGFIDWQGKLVIPASFDQAFDFHEKLALVKQGDMYGFIDHSGKFVIKPEYKNAESFSEGLAAVQIDGKWGYINQQGQLAIQPKFAWVGNFSEGLAVASLDCEKDRNHMFGEPFNSEKYHYGFIDTEGQFKLNPKYIGASPFQFGIARVLEPADVATKAFFFPLGFIVPARIPIVQRYIYKDGTYLQNYKELL